MIAKTYDLQKEELKETRNQLEISIDAQKKQVKLAALTALLTAKLMQIDGLNTKVIAFETQEANIPKVLNDEEQKENTLTKSSLDSQIKTYNSKIEDTKNEVIELENKIKLIGVL